MKKLPLPIAILILIFTLYGSIASFAVADSTPPTTEQTTVVDETVPTEAADTEKPTAPANLTVKEVTDKQVSLVWDVSDDNIGVAGYAIVRDNEVYAYVTEPTFVDTKVKMGETYVYEVTSYDSDNNFSDYSNVVKAVIPVVKDVTPPSRPVNLKIAALKATEVTITWDPSTDNVAVAGYYVIKNGKPLPPVKNPIFKDKAVKQGETVTYKITAYDKSDNFSGYSLTLKVPFVKDITPPTRPGDITIVSQTDSAVVLYWAGSKDNVALRGYYVLRDGKPYEISYSQKYTDKKAKAGETHKYKVTAFDFAGNYSGYNKEVTVTVTE